MNRDKLEEIWSHADHIERNANKLKHENEKGGLVLNSRVNQILGEVVKIKKEVTFLLMTFK